MSESWREMARSTFGSSARAIAGGKSLLCREGCVAPREIIRGPVFAVVAALGAVVFSAAALRGSCGAIVRVTFGMTVLLSRSPAGFPAGTTSDLSLAGATLPDEENTEPPFVTRWSGG